MSIDGLSLHAIIFDLQKLINGKIDKVQQPDKDSILLTIRSNSTNYKLYTSIHSENGRTQLTHLSYENPAEPPMFCMLLRKHLVGCRIESIQQYGLDRVFSINCTGRNELGDSTKLQLFAELMDRHSNITLVQNGVIVDCLRRVSADMSPVRILLPGLRFELPPPQNKNDLFKITESDCKIILNQSNPISYFQNMYSGLSKSLSTLLLQSAETPIQFYHLLQQLKDNAFQPNIIYDQNNCPITVVPFTPVGISCVKYNDFAEAFDTFYKSKDSFVRIQRNASSLKKTIGIKLKRARNKLSLYQSSIDSDASTEQYMLFGNLINSNLYNLTKGMNQYTVTNYYSESPSIITVPADPLLSPSDNAQKYFKRYKKAKAAKQFAMDSIQHEKEEIQYLESQLDNIDKCTKLSELEEIHEELANLKYIKSNSKTSASKKACSNPLCFVSSDNIRIYVGKNNKQNEYLTFKFAKQSNIWLHVKEYTGSHVLIDYEGEVPKSTLYEAATLAAYYSHASASPSVQVDYTLRKYIKKKPSGKPGNVIYTDQKSMLVTSDPNIITKLKEISEEKK